MKVLIVNVHSACNLGDQAIMAATIAGLRELDPAAEIVVAANDPGSWQALPGPQPYHVAPSFTAWVERLRGGRWRGSLAAMALHALLLTLAAAGFRLFGLRPVWGAADKRALLRAYYDADLVLSCGGGNFYSYKAASPFLLWALLALLFAAALGKRVVMLPQSIGPIRGRAQRALARLVFNRMHRIMVREGWSESFLRDTLRVRAPVTLLPDLAFGLVYPSAQPHDAAGAPAVGVTVLDLQPHVAESARQQGYEKALLTLLTGLAREHGARITLFVQVSGPSADQDDRRVTRRLYEALRAAGVSATLAEPFETAAQAIQAYSRMDLLVGSRMHSGIFALASGRPALLIGYQPKGCGVMAMCGMERYCCSISELSAEALQLRAAELLAPDAALRGRLEALGPAMRARLAFWPRRMQERG